MWNISLLLKVWIKWNIRSGNNFLWSIISSDYDRGCLFISISRMDPVSCELLTYSWMRGTWTGARWGTPARTQADCSPSLSLLSLSLLSLSLFTVSSLRMYWLRRRVRLRTWKHDLICKISQLTFDLHQINKTRNEFAHKMNLRMHGPYGLSRS